jgi:hypothetical protein
MGLLSIFPLLRPSRPITLVLLAVLATTCGREPFSSGPASELLFTAEPTTQPAGATFSPALEVTVRDQFGNTATGFAGDVTVAIGTNPTGGTLAGTTTVAAVAGVATFTDLSIDRAGTGYTLSATATSVTGTMSAAFDITAGPATQLIF